MERTFTFERFVRANACGHLVSEGRGDLAKAQTANCSLLSAACGMQRADSALRLELAIAFIDEQSKP
jgi:hypothetical protein